MVREILLGDTMVKHNSKAKIRIGPAGVLFFDRTSGLNVLLDEVRAPMATWAAAPRQVSIALNDRCDLSCPYCFAPKSRAMLAMEQIKRWLHELDTNGTIGIGFGGGEPTLYPEFAELCRYASRNTGLAVTFTSHGHHLDDHLLGELHGHVHFVRISMDGVGRTYETLRGKSFTALCERVRAVRRVVRFGLNLVVNAMTLPDLSAVAALAAELGASELLLLPEQPVRGRPGIDYATRETLFAWVKDYVGPVRLAISQMAADGFPTCDPFTAEDSLTAYAHIDARGVLKATSFDHDGVPIGADGVIAALQRLRQSDSDGML